MIIKKIDKALIDNLHVDSIMPMNYGSCVELYDLIIGNGGFIFSQITRQLEVEIKNEQQHDGSGNGVFRS